MVVDNIDEWEYNPDTIASQATTGTKKGQCHLKRQAIF